MNPKISLRELDATTQAAVTKTRETVARWHAELPVNNLVVWTTGNVSQWVVGTELFVIKPSGVRYDELAADNMMVCDLEGNKIADGTAETLRPSSDTAAHAHVYRHLPQVGGVVHTHSPYATAFVAVYQPIPCVLTMIADKFGGEVPVGPFAIVGDDSVGRDIAETLWESRSPAVLMGNYGPFTVGKDTKAAVKAAVMMGEIAKTVIFTKSLGTPRPIDPAAVDALWQRYQNVYGQSENQPDPN